MDEMKRHPLGAVGTAGEQVGMYAAGHGDAVTVYVGGDLTAENRRDLQQFVVEALARGERDVVVDLRSTFHIDTPGLGMLVMLAKRVRAEGGTFGLAHVSSDVEALLALTKLDAVLGRATGASEDGESPVTESAVAA